MFPGESFNQALNRKPLFLGIALYLFCGCSPKHLLDVQIKDPCSQSTIQEATEIQLSVKAAGNIQEYKWERADGKGVFQGPVGEGMSIEVLLSRRDAGIFARTTVGPLSIGEGTQFQGPLVLQPGRLDNFVRLGGALRNGACSRDSLPSFFRAHTLLSSGTVLVQGGVSVDAGKLSSHAGLETFSVQTGEFSDINETLTINGAARAALVGHTLHEISKDKWIVVGGLREWVDFNEEAKNVATRRILIGRQVDHSITDFVETAHPRGFHSGTVLDDGRVLHVGGRCSRTDSISTTAVACAAESCIDGASLITEIYDPIKNSVECGPKLNNPRFLHQAKEISSGQIVIAGGQTLVKAEESIELIDINEGTSEVVGSFRSPKYFSSIAITEGWIVASGGSRAIASRPEYSEATADIEILKNEGNSFIHVDEDCAEPLALREPRSAGAITPLTESDYLIVAGVGESGEFLSSAERLVINPESPCNSEFLPVAIGLKSGQYWPNLTVLAWGDVLVTGGVRFSGGSLRATESVELYIRGDSNF